MHSVLLAPRDESPFLPTSPSSLSSSHAPLLLPTTRPALAHLRMQYSRYNGYQPPPPPPPQRFERTRAERFGGGGGERWQDEARRRDSAEVSGAGRDARRSGRESTARQWDQDQYYSPPRRQYPVSYAQPQRSNSFVREGARASQREEGGSDRRRPAVLPPKPSFLPPRPPSEVCLNPPPPKRAPRSYASSASSAASRSPPPPPAYRRKPVMATTTRQEWERSRGGQRPSQAGARPFEERFQPGPYARHLAPKQHSSLTTYPYAYQPPPRPLDDALGPFPPGSGLTRTRFVPPQGSSMRQPFVPPSATAPPSSTHKVYKVPAPSSYPPPAQQPSASYRFPPPSSSYYSATSPISSFSASPTSSRTGPSPTTTTATTATSPPPPAKLSPGDPNPPWLEAELFGPAYGTWEKGMRKVGEGKERGGGAGKRKRAFERAGEGEEEGEEEDPVGEGLDWVDWEKRERRRKRRRR